MNTMKRILLEELNFSPYWFDSRGYHVCSCIFQNVIHGPIIALLTWVIYIGITGGLHIDGLADTLMDYSATEIKDSRNNEGQ